MPNAKSIDKRTSKLLLKYIKDTIRKLRITYDIINDDVSDTSSDESDDEFCEPPRKKLLQKGRRN